MTICCEKNRLHINEQSILKLSKSALYMRNILYSVTKSVTKYLHVDTYNLVNINLGIWMLFLHMQ